MDDSEIITEQETDVALISLRADGIVLVHFKPHTTLDINLQLHMRNIYHSLTKGVSAGFVFSAAEGFSITKEARENFRNIQINNPIKAYAIVAQGIAQNLVANFFLRFYRPGGHIRVFKRQDDAIAWIRSLD